MSVNKIYSASGTNDLRSVAKIAGDSFSKRTAKSDLNTDLVSQENSRFTLDDEVFVWGSGTDIGTAGQIVFTSASGYGSLREAIVVNRGSQEVFFGLNNQSIHVSSGTALLEGESVKLNGPINTIWAITSSSTANIEVQGILNRNIHTV